MPDPRWSLEGKSAIVTGGGTGLGQAMALALAEAGAAVAVAGRRPGPLEETAAQIRRKGGRALAVSADVTVSEQVNRLRDRVLEEWGKIDILVNNAGGGTGGAPNLPGGRPGELKTIWDITDEDWHRGIDTNLTGTFFCSRAVMRHMVERGQGKIINTTSGHGLRAGRDQYMYCAAKAGVIMLTQTLALTFARHGINANCIAPGYFRTRPILTDEDREFWVTRDRFMPAGRVGRPEELGPLVVFLASEASSYINGETFIIDGGSLVGGLAPTNYIPTASLPQRR